MLAFTANSTGNHHYSWKLRVHIATCHHFLDRHCIGGRKTSCYPVLPAASSICCINARVKRVKPTSPKNVLKVLMRNIYYCSPRLTFEQNAVFTSSDVCRPPDKLRCHKSWLIHLHCIQLFSPNFAIEIPSDHC